jgi:16S rRNA (cytosine967-C5)-methyltransferase
MRRACDWLLAPHLQRSLDDDVRAALRLGAYQLALAGTSPHAAVAATVDAAPPRARGLVNAVLRKVASTLPPSWPNPATELSYPDWIVERLSADIGPAAALGALEEMNRPATATERADGYVQDDASQRVAALVEPDAGDRAGDLCAAPGGKATFLAAPPPEATTSGPPSLVVAGDVREPRARVVAANATRLGLSNLAALVADGRQVPLRDGALDRALVDAPCSGLGALRRRPDARWRVDPDDVARLVRLQRELLIGARDAVRAGGTLVYSVCTMTAEETLGIDEWLAERHPELVALDRPDRPWAAHGRGALLLPQAAGTDGMYLLRLRRLSWSHR